MIYLTPRERTAITMATSICFAIIILAVCVAAGLGALTCPTDVFC